MYYTTNRVDTLLYSAYLETKRVDVLDVHDIASVVPNVF